MVIWIGKYTHILQLNTALIFSSCHCQTTSAFIPIPFFSLAFQGWRPSTLDINTLLPYLFNCSPGEISPFYLLSEQTPTCMSPCTSSLCMLSVADLILSTTAMPKILSIFGSMTGRSILTYLVQVFLIHSLCMASGFILAMAFDRHVAICNPLRHSIILTHRVIQNVGLAIIFRGVYFSVLNPLCFEFGFPTAELMSSLTLLWIYGSDQAGLCRDQDLQNIQPNCCLPHWRFRFHINPLFLRCHPSLSSIFHPKLLGSRPWALVDPMCVWSWVTALQPFSPSLLTDLDTMWLLLIHIFVANIYVLVPPMVKTQWSIA